MRPDGAAELFEKYVDPAGHHRSDYFGLINALVQKKLQTSLIEPGQNLWQKEIEAVYGLVEEELLSNQGSPVCPVSFGTSGWRGILGKDLFVKSVQQVSLSIIQLYHDLEDSQELGQDLGVGSLAEARRRGCVLGHDNRFGGGLLAKSIRDVLTSDGFRVYCAGESTTGALSAAVLQLEAAFSINLTPSHNPLEYGGLKFNAADAGPAAAGITRQITDKTLRIMEKNAPLIVQPDPSLVEDCDALDCWMQLVRKGRDRHGLDYERIISDFKHHQDMALVVDCVNGASRIHIRRLLQEEGEQRLVLLREASDPTFGGVAPEPSTANLQGVLSALEQRQERLKLGVIIDPDADRIRFTDGKREITMNHFGAMAYHFIHEVKGKRGMVAKSVATSNLANQLATSFGEEVFESRVGFKEFKPVIDRALVCFEESDGITILGHTPEKDAYIGLILALDMMLSLEKNLGDYLEDIEKEYGFFCPTKDGITVGRKGKELQETLALLGKYQSGDVLTVHGEKVAIREVIAIDGYKLVLEDGSWIMIRPSGTEPKVRFYVESRSPEGQQYLLDTAKALLGEIGLAES